MLQPTVTYRHSETARRTARVVTGTKPSAWSRMTRAELEQLAADLEACGPTGDLNKLGLIDHVQAVAIRINGDSSEDYRLAADDPVFRRKGFFHGVRAAYESAQEKYANVYAKVANPLHLDWSYATSLIEAATKVEALAEVLRGASYGSYRSTNPVSNVLADYKLRALAEGMERSYF